MRRAIYLAAVLLALALCPAASAHTSRLSMSQAKRALASYERGWFVERRHDSIIPIRWRRQSRWTIHVRAKVLTDLALVDGVERPFYTTTVLTLQVEHRAIWILDRLPGGGWERVS